ncbi:MAG: prepilin peptidase [Candidatus Eremiobacteraeota bacterium]|nr:prepilin peptidase [Candidatus Eremiobacteraeota bacterium]
MFTEFGEVSLAIWLVLAACALAVITDLRARRVPNALCAALAVAALTLHAMQGWVAFAVALATLVVVLALGSVAFSFRWLGGGDVKLLAAGAATLGLPDAFPFLVYTALAGGVLALVVALATGRLRAVVASVTLILRPLAFHGTTAVAPRNPIMLPYAVAIGCGALAVALSHSAAPFLKLPL